MNRGSHPLLIEEPFVVVLPSLAKALSLNEALLLQQIQYFAQRSEDGWVRRTIAEWHRWPFTFMSTRTIRRALTQLKERGILEGVAEEGSLDRALSYRIDYDAMRSICPHGAANLAGGGAANLATCVDDVRSTAVKNVGSPSEGDKATPHSRFLCRLLADLILQRDPKAKVAPDSERWLRAMRLLVESDGRSPVEVERVIRWCQADSFWQANILSAPTLRDKFDRLVAQSAPKEAWQQEPVGPSKYDGLVSN